MSTPALWSSSRHLRRRALPILGDAALCALLLAACASGYSPASDASGPRCGDGILQSNLGEQCDDGNVYGGDGCSANCRVEAGVETDCANGLDDDGDGLVDCADPGCQPDPQCQGVRETICDNGLDDDGDGVVDCDDPDCGALPACARTPEQNCTNGVDDDADGHTDCADSDCAADPACLTGGESLCDNGLDDDGDGLADCADSDCDGRACGSGGRICQGTACVCPGGLVTEVACQDGRDDDCDGLTDCADPDCAATTVCAGTETDCANGLDDDGDGLTDCADGDCLLSPCDANGRQCSGGACVCPGGSTESSCADSADDDCDGLIDCADPDCAADAACVTSETDCSNGLDDDGDSLVDCADTVDCTGASCGANGLVCQGGTCACPTGINEICGDNVDNNCNGQIDENCAPTTCSDPLSPSFDCGSGYHCMPQPTLGAPGQCVSPVGLGTQYSSCTTDADCAAPFTCANTGTGVWCLQYCTSWLDCPFPLSEDCYPFNPPMYVGTQEWGACWDGY